MSRLGKFIVVEGLEGAGKSTAVQSLMTTLSQLDIEAKATREPGGTAIGEVLRGLIKNPDYKTSLTDKTELLLLYAARMQLLEEVIKPSLASGCWVVADRFELSTFAYQGGGRNLDPTVIQTLSQFCLEGFKPDLTLFLDVPLELGLQRIGLRGQLDRIEQQSHSFFKAVHQAYQQHLQHYPNVVTIDASLPLEVVQAQIVQTIQQFVTSQTL